MTKRLKVKELYPNEASPRLFECHVDRSETEMPDNYLPGASAAWIAGEGMLRAAGYVPGSDCPGGWSPWWFGFKKFASDGNTCVWVQKFGQFWAVGRSILNCPIVQNKTLVCAFGRMPIWTRTRPAAMRLAEHCDPIPRPPVAGHWADVRAAG